MHLPGCISFVKCISISDSALIILFLPEKIIVSHLSRALCADGLPHRGRSGWGRLYLICPLPFPIHFSVTNFSNANGPRA
jgi:hypothetical protein